MPLLRARHADALSSYKEMRVGDINVCYNDTLPSLPPSPPSAGGGADDLSTPFCCGAVAPYKARRLEREALFTAFVEGRGHHPNLYFQVRFAGERLRAEALVVQEGWACAL
jgi:hypothetical protein